MAFKLLVVCQKSICLKRFLVIYLLKNGMLQQKKCSFNIAASVAFSEKANNKILNAKKIIQFFPFRLQSIIMFVLQVK